MKDRQARAPLPGLPTGRDSLGGFTRHIAADPSTPFPPSPVAPAQQDQPRRFTSSSTCFKAAIWQGRTGPSFGGVGLRFSRWPALQRTLQECKASPIGWVNRHELRPASDGAAGRAAHEGPAADHLPGRPGPARRSPSAGHRGVCRVLDHHLLTRNRLGRSTTAGSQAHGAGGGPEV